MSRVGRSILGLVVAICLTIIAVTAVLWRRTSARVREIPFSRATSTGVVGADWATRHGHEGEPVVGEIDDFSAFDRPGFDADAVAPAIRRFYERTGEYDMAYDVRWHGAFRPGAWLASIATSRLEQLNLPGRSETGVRHLESHLAEVPEDVDPRGSVVWTRTDPERETAVFVAVYATHAHEGTTYANVAVPLPWSNLSTVLRPGLLDGGKARDPDEAEGGRGVEFTTNGGGDGGLYLVTPVGPLALPMEQSFRVWPAGSPTAPASPIPDVDLVATHEMWICGRQFLTITYGIQRSERAERMDANQDGANG